MLKQLFNLPIRLKFAVIILPLVVIILAFDYLQILEHYRDYKNSSRLNSAITVGIEIGHAVHEIQKERSISTGVITNRDASFQRRLSMQRARTDSTLQRYFDEIKTDKLQNLLDLHKEDINRINSFFEKIPDIRKAIDNQNITSEESIDRFSEINNIALNTVNQLIDETNDKYAAQHVHALIYFQKAKEYASVERAVGTQAFSHNHLGFDLYNKFTSIVAFQNAFLEASHVIADNEFLDFYEDNVQGTEVEKVQEMREILFENDSLSADPSEWYEASTARINLLKRVEDFLSDNIQEYTSQKASRAMRNFWTFMIMDIALGLLTFWLMTVIASNLLKNVKKLEDFTRKISSGNLKEKVHIDSNDELGQYAKTFNQMVTEIRKSHYALRKQRDKAKFLYENIYGVSLVVFENIQQGIFLLDREFRISKFHSRAMKTIFNNDRIAGEHFASFMRPIILPRDLEALEMFMRHLFNEDMDEEVVNQLNPIDQVKIHTEQDGIVSTKYIRVEFTRVFRKGRIQHIMVTVSDETESVLLQQHLDEAEKKKQEETERVLSILKIDPSVLRGFLHNSRKMLKSISEKYEQNNSDEFKDLLSFTLDTIHNLKGNASVIGLDLMANKFHDIEEATIKLQDKDVQGKDFLAILYEIDDADRMIGDISGMLEKIVNIYKTFPADGHSVTNIMVIDTMERGVEVISEEVGKSAELNFKNNDNIVIPDDYIESFKDVMIQLVRNSIVHGIEPPSARISAGKIVKGEICIELDRTPKDDLLIRYSDDGAGLDLEKIKAKAITRGLVTESEVNTMDENEVPYLIFKEGFSTSEKSNKHAGRGQGMHLVQSLIEDINGSYELHYEKGKSFGITITLPSIGEKLVAS